MLTVRNFRIGKPRLLIFAFAFAVAAIVLGLMRFPDRVFDPQLRDEDGYLFFIDDRIIGLRALLQPVNGYIYILQRLVAFIAGLFHPSLVPYFYNGTAFVLTACVAARIAIARLPIPWRIGFCLVFLLQSIGTAQAIHFTNMMWFAAILIPILAIERAPTNLREQAFTLVAVAILGLSGPFTAIFSPLYLLSLIFLDRSRYRFLLTGVIAVTASIQIAVFVNSWRLENTIDTQHPAITGSWILINRFFVHSFFARFADEKSILQSVLSLGAFTLLVAGASFRNSRAREEHLRLPILAFGFILAYTASALGSFVPWTLVDPSKGESRYYILPYLLFGWIVIALAVTPITRTRRWMCAPAVILLFAAALTKFYSPLKHESTWSEDIARIESTGAGVVRLYPAEGLNHIYLKTGVGLHGFASGAELEFFKDSAKVLFDRFGLHYAGGVRPRNFPNFYPYSAKDSDGIVQFAVSSIDIEIPEGATGFRGKCGHAPTAVPPGWDSGMAGGDGIIINLTILEGSGKKSDGVKMYFPPKIVKDPPELGEFHYKFPPGNWKTLYLEVSIQPSTSNTIAYDFLIWNDLAFEFN